MTKQVYKMSPFVEAVAIRAKFFPDYIPAVIFGDEKINWSTLFTRIKRLANALKDKGNVKKGDKVTFIFHNSPEFIEINFACQMLGAVPVPVNYRYIASEIEYTVNDCDSVVLLCEEAILKTVLEIVDDVPKVKLFVVNADSAPDGFVTYKEMVNYPKDKLIKVSAHEDDVGVIIYTGGTTGRSKGVMLTNRNLLTNQESIIRSLVLALPKINLKCVKYAETPGERKYLQAFDIFNSYFEGLYEDEGYEDTVLVLKVIGDDNFSDVSATMVQREGLVKIMIGAPKDDEIDILLTSNMDEQFRSLTNMLPFVYTKKGRKKALRMTLGNMIRRKIKLKGSLKVKLKLVKSLMKTSKAREGDEDRSEEFLSLLVVPPMFHLASYAFFLMFTTYVGGTCMIPKEWSFNVDDIFSNIEKNRPKWVFLVPTMYSELLCTKAHKYDITSVRVALSGAALLKGEDKKKLLKFFPNAIIVDAFGQTEMSAIAAMKIDTDPDLVKHGSVGKLGPGINVKIVGEDGKEMPEGEVGEMYYSGKSIMKGYYGDQEKTSRTIDDGWLHSGDLGYIKDGELYTVDRKGECINTGAEKVFPIEVEEILHEHPSIKDVCIIGVPDEKWGKTVRAIITLRENKGLTDAELKDWCTGKMAGYKKPRSVIIVDELPISPVGKVLRGKIRSLYGQPKVND